MEEHHSAYIFGGIISIVAFYADTASCKCIHIGNNAIVCIEFEGKRRFSLVAYNYIWICSKTK